MNDSKILIFLPKEMSVYLNATMLSNRRLLWFIFKGSAIFLACIDGWITKWLMLLACV